MRWLSYQLHRGAVVVRGSLVGVGVEDLSEEGHVVGGIALQPFLFHGHGGSSNAVVNRIGSPCLLLRIVGPVEEDGYIGVLGKEDWVPAHVSRLKAN